MDILRRFIRTGLVHVVGGAIIVFVVVLVAFSPRGTAITDQTFDVLRTTPARGEAVIVGIDDKSLTRLGAWPWDRGVFAALTTKLSLFGAKSVVYDVLFLEPREGDDAFARALSTTAVPIVLASKIENKAYLSSYLIASTTRVSSAVANVNPDSDGKVRFYAPPVVINGSCTPGLSDAAFAIATFKESTSCTSSTSMFRYPPHVVTYSLSDVLDGNIPASAFTQKTVFVGVTSLDLLDVFVGMNGEKIPGVYVHASMFVSKLNNVHDVPLARNLSIVWFALSALCVGFLFAYLKNLFAQIGTLIALIAFTIGSAVILFNEGIIIPWPWILSVIVLVAGYTVLLEMLVEHKKNAYIEAMFAKYVHKDVLKELMKSSASLRFDGERRDMTILFSDLRGFTTISEKMQPEELTKLLNEYFSAMTPCILGEKGTIDKFIGDAVMAFWNAPLLVDNHPTRAVHAALSMQKALTAFNQSHATPLAMGVGVHRGEVIVGNVGSTERVNYTILGDAVNLASRIEGLTKKYGVTCIVTDVVRNAVNDPAILFRKLDVITVKGKSEPSILYEAHLKEGIDLNTITSYEKAFTAYEQGDFDEAETIFKVLKERGDGPSETMLGRIPLLREKDGWDGVWHFDEK